MPRRTGPKRFVQDLQFPTGGLVETSAVEDQPPNTTIDCENVRAFPSNLVVTKAAGLNATFNGRNRGGQRPGLSAYLTDSSGGNLPFQTNDAAPIQDIQHLVWSEVTKLFGEGHSIIHSANGFILIDVDGVQVGSGEGGAGTETWQLAVWASDGSAYVATIDSNTKVVVRRIDALADGSGNPTEKWDTTDIAASLIEVNAATNRPVRGMQVWGDTLYLWVGDLAESGVVEAIFRFDTSSGKLRDGSNDTYWKKSYSLTANTGSFHKSGNIANNFSNNMAISRGRMGLLNVNYSGGNTGADNISTALAHSAGAAGVKTALEALSAISSGDVAVTGISAKSDDGLIVEFTGIHANRNVPQITINSAGLAQVTAVTCVRDDPSGDPAHDLNGKHFLIYDGKNQKYMVWFKTGAAEAAVAKVGGLFKALKVTIATNAADTVVATAVKDALDAESEFTATVASAVVTVTAATAGDSTAAAAGDSGFTVPAPSTVGLTGLTAKNEIQVVRLKGSPTHGTTTLTLNHGGGPQTTGAIAYDATADSTRLELEKLSNITATLDEKWSLYTPDDSAEKSYLAVVAEATTLAENIDNTQTTFDVAAVSGDRFDLAKFYGHTEGSGQVRQIQIGDEVMKITGISGTTLTVLRAETGAWDSGTATVGQPASSGVTVYHRQVTATGAGAANTPSQVKTILTATDSDAMDFFTSGVNEKQDITISGGSDGTFQLEFKGIRTANIAYTATAGTVDTALEAISSIGSGNVTCTGGPLNTSPVICEFVSGLDNENHPLMKIAAESADFDATTKTVVESQAGKLDDLTGTGTALNNVGDPVIMQIRGYWAGKTLKVFDRYDGNYTNPWEDNTFAIDTTAAASDIKVTGGWDLGGSVPEFTIEFVEVMKATDINKMTATTTLFGSGDETVKIVSSTNGAPLSTSATTTVQGSNNYTEKQVFKVVAAGGNYRLSYNAENSLHILDLNTSETLSVTQCQTYGKNQNSANDIDVDPAGNFYTITFKLDGSTYEFATSSYDNEGAKRWQVTGTSTTRSLAYDPTNSRLFVAGQNVMGTTESFAVVTAVNGTIETSFSPYEDTIDPDTGSGYDITNWNEVQVTHTGEVLLYRNNNTDGIAKLSNATVPLELWIKTLGKSKMVGAACAAVYALNPENSLAVRQIQSFAVSGGRVREFQPAALYQAQPVDRWVDLANDTGGGNGAAPPLRADVPVFSAQLGNNIFYVDGEHYKYYDSASGELKTWTATKGTLPSDSSGNTAKLITLYRGRIVLAGVDGDPANFFMSAVGDAFDFDYGATPISETMAVAGGGSPAGKAPDKINTMIAMADNVLLIGCDHSVYAIMGDIAAEGGRIDILTEDVGLAWGMGAYCKDPYGTFYAFGSRGGIYAGQLGGQVTKISTPAVEERMATTIDMGTDIINMVWNEREQGFHVFVSSLKLKTDGIVPDATTNYFYDTRNQAWWIDKFANTKHQPQCVHVYDGDAPGDRAILVGGWDGIIRKWDPDCKTDGNVTGDTTAISSHVYLGPFTAGAMASIRLEEMQPIIAEGSGTVSYAVYVGDSPHEAYNQSTSRFTGSWSANRNKSERRTATGNAIYLKLSNTTTDAWAMEGLRCQYREVRGPRVTRRS